MTEDLHPARSLEAQEALSRVYSDGISLILPLRSGRFAVFGNDRKIRAIVDRLEDALPIVMATFQAVTFPKD